MRLLTEGMRRRLVARTFCGNPRRHWRKVARKSSQSSAAILQWIVIGAGTGPRRLGTQLFMARGSRPRNRPLTPLPKNIVKTRPMNSCPR